ncbi:hypothetical protein EYR38_005489 [Pleurotus pulmonarius]|nr:hypothetical protein EYR38_005489 [Pleurotus pulmonarius]
MTFITGDNIWDQALTNVIDLSAGAVKRAADLEGEVNELRREVANWRQAHSNLREAAEWAVTTSDTAPLRRQLYAVTHPPELQNRSLIFCVINGNVNPFHDDLIARGFEGGQIAARELTRTIAEYLTNEGAKITLNNISFWTTVFFNKTALLDRYVSEQICTRETFRNFNAGFSQASTRFAMVDVGPFKDVAEAKIREYLETYTWFPQTLRLFLGDASGSKYTETFRTLNLERLLGKIVFLGGHTDAPGHRGHATISAPTLGVEGVFQPPSSHLPPQKPSPLTVPTSNVTVATNGGLISPKSPSRGTRLIDPTLNRKPLHKRTPDVTLCSEGGWVADNSIQSIENPPPCNEHYLMTCSKGPALCKYSHDYLLTPEQLACLASNAKKAPCNWLKNGSSILVGPITADRGGYEPDESDLLPSSTPGYKPGAAKSADEYAKLDAEDESLARWKASLGIVPGAATGAADGPRVTVLSLELYSDTLPAGKTLIFDLTNKETLDSLKKNTVTIKEGIEYNVRMKFKVNHSIISGVRYLQVVKRSGIKVDKMEQMLGSYGPHPQGEPYTKNFDPEESPSGMLARSGTYHVRSRVVDDDGEVFADWEWSFKLAKEW